MSELYGSAFDLSTSDGQLSTRTAEIVSTSNDSVPAVGVTCTTPTGVPLVKSGAPGSTGFLSGSGQILLGQHAGTSLMEWALRYAENGYHVFPLKQGTKNGYYSKCPRCNEKSGHYDADAHVNGAGHCTAHPAGYARCHGLYAATRNADVIRSWWTEDPFANIGINCGWSNVVLVDTDITGGKNGEDRLVELETTHGRLPNSPHALSASGGHHRLFRPPTGVTVRNSTSVLAPGIDIKATGGLMIAAPSVVVDDKTRLVKGQYTWLSTPQETLPELPGWILEEIERNKPKTIVPAPHVGDRTARASDVRDRVQQLADMAAFAPEGTRNKTLNDNAFMAFQYAAAGQIDPDEVEFIFTQAGSAADPHDTAQVARTVASARNGAANKPRTWNTRNNVTSAVAREGQDVTETVDIPEQRDSGIPSGTYYSHPDAPMRVARELEYLWNTPEGKTLYHWRDTWMAWTGTHWTEEDSSAIRSRLYLKLEDALFLAVNKQGKEEVKPWNPTSKKISNLVDAISAINHLASSVENGSWLGREGENGLISCRNTLVNPTTRSTSVHTPTYFTTTSVPYDYDPEAQCPVWLNFLDQLFGDDTESIQALQEWAGYVISGRTDLQKGIQLIGPPRAGKGTFARIMEKLIGAENAVGTTLGSLGTDFGLQPLIDKAMCVIGDAHMENRSMAAIVTRLLMITGEDSITIDRKNKAHWKGKMTARVMLLANKPPRFSDASGAIVKRWVTVQFTKSFLGKEDNLLEPKLTEELPGIFNWALEGLDRLNKNRRFTQPESALGTIQTQQENAAPHQAFIEECCAIGPDHWIVKDNLFAAWKSYCLNNNIQAVGTASQFATDLYAASTGVRDGKQKRIKGSAKRIFAGITVLTDPGIVVPDTQTAAVRSDQ